MVRQEAVVAEAPKWLPEMARVMTVSPVGLCEGMIQPVIGGWGVEEEEKGIFWLPFVPLLNPIVPN